MVHAVDVTDKVKAREEIATARAEADHANRAKSEFLAAMSHDLRTPLNAIGGYADLVKDGLYGPVTDAQVNAMLRIRRAEEHLLTLINDILSYAKIEAGRLTIELTDVPVNEMLAELRMLIAPQVAAKGLAYEFRAGPTDLRIRADRERATQIMLNLLTNAVKFTTEGKITVDFEVTNGDVIIRVSDTGPGIAPDRMATIFDPFVQVGRFGEPRREGVGLGLAISRELARAMGGDLAAVSELGHGSTFTVRLPRAVD
jgi:signal transduction histidine kinase